MAWWTALIALVPELTKGLQGGGGGSVPSVQVSTQSSQVTNLASNQASGVVFNPIVNVSSPGSRIDPDIGPVTLPAPSPINQNANLPQTNRQDAVPYLPSLSLPYTGVGDVQSPSDAYGGGYPASGQKTDAGFLAGLSEDYTIWLIIGGAVFLLMIGDKKKGGVS